ncbi:hypothetical protein BJX68DRAFT_262507 [Aspergillus pseudodeflectus]|uniref:Uncharacterized protein n=1 Tax=Aspergillus pseudodeflectus TaxID=176178 RepID=A0ABR4L3B9_9EURO
MPNGQARVQFCLTHLSFLPAASIATQHYPRMQTHHAYSLARQWRQIFPNLITRWPKSALSPSILPRQQSSSMKSIPSFGATFPAQYSDTLGKIDSHNVVLACLPSGGYGTSPAPAVVCHLQANFFNVRVGLMVGIGGGAPSDTVDIRLGGVVVSKPTGTCGGVIRYDFGKTVGEGRFQRIGMLNQPPPSS